MPAHHFRVRRENRAFDLSMSSATGQYRGVVRGKRDVGEGRITFTERSIAMNERFTVRVSKDYLVFSAAHFITYDGDQCERLHGHNYRASVELGGPLDQNHYVFDFIALKDYLRQTCDKLDHRVLLPTQSTLIAVEQNGDEVTARFANRRWVFPCVDCVLLPIENTTAELLAHWIAGQLSAAIEHERGFVPSRIAVEVEENFGQSAVYESSA